MKINSLIILLFFLFNYAYSLDKTTYYSYGVEFDGSSFATKHPNQDSIKLFISYRLLYDVLSFKELNEGDKSIFFSDVDIEVVLTDDGGVIRKRANKKDSVFANSFEETNSKELYHKGFFEFSVKNSNYSVNLTVIDRFKKKINQKIFIKKLDYKKLLNSSDILFYRQNAQSNLYDLSNYVSHNAFLFDKNEVSLLMNIDSNDYNYFYEVEFLKNNEENDIYNFWSDKSISFENKAEVLTDKNIDFKTKKDQLTFDLKNGTDKYLKISFPTDKIIPGSYKIKIYNENEDTVERYFEVNWENKPLSLDRISYAIERMYYILTDEEYDKLNNSSQQLKDFIEYWKKLDPTPDTPYNEALVQYFTRVDYAFFNFASLAEKDGANTDRGKIFILYGAPTEIQDKNIENKKGIIWNYKNLNKKFYFQVVSSGFTKLIKIEEW